MFLVGGVAFFWLPRLARRFHRLKRRRVMEKTAVTCVSWLPRGACSGRLLPPTGLGGLGVAAEGEEEANRALVNRGVPGLEAGALAHPRCWKAPESSGREDKLTRWISPQSFCSC